MIVDAVGVTEQELVDTGTVERKRSVPLKSLLEAVAVGAVDDDLLASLARRLALLEKRLTPAQRQEVESLLDVPAAPERFTDLRAAVQRHAGCRSTRTAIRGAGRCRTASDPHAGPTEPSRSEAARQAAGRRGRSCPLAASPSCAASCWSAKS